MIETKNKQIKKNQHGSLENQKNSDMSSIQNSQIEEPTSGKLAREEFSRIKNMINVVSSTPMFAKTGDNKCPDKPMWCLPDVNCTARVTMNNDASQAFFSNQDFCKLPIIVD